MQINQQMMKMKMLMTAALMMTAAAAYAGDNVLPSWALGGFVRPQGVNPLVSPIADSRFLCPMTGESVKWECADTFNPAAVVRDGQVCVLYRAEDNPDARLGHRTSRIGLVTSKDGLRVDSRAAEPVMFPDTSLISRHFEWEGGTEDPRVVEAEVDGRPLYVMTYTAWNRYKFRLSIATSRDLHHWTHHGPAFRLPLNGLFSDLACKSGSIVTEVRDGRLQAAKVKINGEEKYLMYWGEEWVCAATSDDLVNWTVITEPDGTLKYLARPRKGYFDSRLTECGPPAVKTADGIILLYNGKNRGGKDGDENYPSGTYAAGQMLFSNDNPLQLLTRLDKPFFRPMADFEKSGQYKDGTVFVEGLVYHQSRWLLYYGCADSFVGVAVCDPSSTPHEGDPINIKPAR